MNRSRKFLAEHTNSLEPILPQHVHNAEIEVVPYPCYKEQGDPRAKTLFEQDISAGELNNLSKIEDQIVWHSCNNNVSMCNAGGWIGIPDFLLHFQGTGIKAIDEHGQNIGINHMENLTVSS